MVVLKEDGKDSTIKRQETLRENQGKIGEGVQTDKIGTNGKKEEEKAGIIGEKALVEQIGVDAAAKKEINGGHLDEWDENEEEVEEDNKFAGKKEVYKEPTLEKNDGEEGVRNMVSEQKNDGTKHTGEANEVDKAIETNKEMEDFGCYLAMAYILMGVARTVMDCVNNRLFIP